MPKPRLPNERARVRDFGRLLRRIREKRGISLRRAARLMNFSPAWLSKAERGLIDVRKVGTVDRIAAALDADVNELRKAAGLESLDLADVWLQIASLGADLAGVRLSNTREQRLSKLLGLIFIAVGYSGAEAKETDQKARRSEAQLEEILRLIALVAHRRHGGYWENLAKAPDESTKALHAAVDVALDGLYRVHAKEIEELLKTK